MSVTTALEALKRRDFAAARDTVAREDIAAFTTQHFLIKGLAELSLQDWSAAQATFAAATGRFPDHVLFWLNRGIAEENLEWIDAAIASQERCLALNPAQAEACGNLSNLYRKKKRFAEAEAMARRALENGAAKTDALNSLGLALGRQGKFAEAEDALRQAQREAPDNPAIILNRANLAVDQLRFDEAWPLFAAARAIKDEPVFRHDEGLARLLSGDFERGLELVEARLDMPHALRIHPTCPRWKGESLAGKKLLILAEQGFGDAIQFCRYQKFLPDGELIWAVPKNLVRLLSGAVRGTVMCENDPLPACDYYAPVMSLPFLTGHMQPEPAENYLTALQAPLLPSGKHKLKIGLIWAGSRTHERDHERSIRLDQLAPIFALNADFYAPFTGDALNEISDFTYVEDQKQPRYKNSPAPRGRGLGVGALDKFGAALSELISNHRPPPPSPRPRGAGEDCGIIRLDPLITDFADTAALLNQLDMLITVDTAAAHLAGALGVKTFLLLPYCPDWRWGVTGEATPWYPSLTLLRQPKYGDWQNVIEKLLSLLKTT